MPDTLHRFSHLILIMLLQRDSSLSFCRDIHLLVQSQIASQAMGDIESLSACLLWLPCSSHGNWASPPFLRLPASLLPAPRPSPPALVTCSVLQSPPRSGSCFLLTRLPRPQPGNLLSLLRHPWPAWTSQCRHCVGGFGGEEWGEKHVPDFLQGKW